VHGRLRAGDARAESGGYSKVRRRICTVREACKVDTRAWIHRGFASNSEGSSRGQKSDRGEATDTATHKEEEEEDNNEA
jgi:hypothetical protein